MPRQVEPLWCVVCCMRSEPLQLLCFTFDWFHAWAWNSLREEKMRRNLLEIAMNNKSYLSRLEKKTKRKEQFCECYWTLGTFDNEPLLIKSISKAFDTKTNDKRKRKTIYSKVIIHRIRLNILASDNDVSVHEHRNMPNIPILYVPACTLFTMPINLVPTMSVFH